MKLFLKEFVNKIFSAKKTTTHYKITILGIKISIRKSIRRLGYLQFNYNAQIFDEFKMFYNKYNVFSVNIGDYIQSISVKRMLQDLFPNKNVQPINRESIANYDGVPITLFCNAIFYNETMPKVGTLTPAFLGFSAVDDPNLINNNLDILKTNSPIGCRDLFTYNLMKQNNIPSFVSGCYSITLPKRKVVPKSKKIFFVGVSEELKKHIPQELLPYSEFIIQRKRIRHWPVNKKDMELLEKDAADLLKRYETEATLVVSPLLHCITPCIGMGIPVILARDEYNERFSAIEKITRLYLKEDYDSIDWNPKAIDIEELKEKMYKIAKYKILNKKIPTNLLDYFNDFYLAKTTWPINLYSNLNDIMENRIKRMLALGNEQCSFKSIMDLGCGEQNLKKYLNDNIKYYPVDVFKRKNSTIIRDFNKGEFLEVNVDLVFCSGVFEYIEDLDKFVSNISRNAKYILGSYIFYNERKVPDYVICHMPPEDFWKIFKKYNYEPIKIIEENTYSDIGKNTLFLLKKED